MLRGSEYKTRWRRKETKMRSARRIQTRPIRVTRERSRGYWEVGGVRWLKRRRICRERSERTKSPAGSARRRVDYQEFLGTINLASATPMGPPFPLPHRAFPFDGRYGAPQARQSKTSPLPRIHRRWGPARYIRKNPTLPSPSLLCASDKDISITTATIRTAWKRDENGHCPRPTSQFVIHTYIDREP